MCWRRNRVWPRDQRDVRRWAVHKTQSRPGVRSSGKDLGRIQWGGTYPGSWRLGRDLVPSLSLVDSFRALFSVKASHNTCWGRDPTEQFLREERRKYSSTGTFMFGLLLWLCPPGGVAILVLANQWGF